MLRPVQAGDFLQPYHGEQPYPAVPQGHVHRLCPKLAAFAWPLWIREGGLPMTTYSTLMPRLTDELRLRRSAMGAHYREAGSATIQGPCHGTVQLHLPNPATPDITEVADQMSRLDNAPPWRAIVRAAVMWPEMALFTTTFDEAPGNPVLLPAPHFREHHFVMLMQPAPGLLEGLPGETAAQLIPRRSLNRGDVLYFQPDPGRAPEPGTDDEQEAAMLLQLRAQVVPGSVANKPSPTTVQAAVDSKAAAADGRLCVPTPHGRRCFQAAIENAEPHRDPSCRVPLPVQPAASGLQDSEGVLSLGLPLEAKDLALNGFALSHLCRSQPNGQGMHEAAAAFLRTVPCSRVEDKPEALLIYVDGSFAQAQGAWAVCCLGLFDGTWCWIGYFADKIAAPIPVRSAFEAEVYAQLVAFGIAACEKIPTTVYDSQSAAAVTCCQAKTSAGDPLTRAAVGLYMCAGVQGHWPAMHHVRAHQGDPLNELVDYVAKVALQHRLIARLGDEHVDDYICEGAYNWLWLYQASCGSCVWPQIDSEGKSVPAQPQESQPLPQAPAGWAALPQEDGPQHITMHLRVATYNTLSCKSALQRQCLTEYMLHQRLHVIGLQEAKYDTVDKQQVQGILRLAGPAPQGQLGCQIWVNLAAGPWERQYFRITFRDSRLLEVQAKLGDQRLVLIAGHSPTAVAPACERRDWWRMLRDRILAAPAGFLPILLLDANARYCMRQNTERPDNVNAHDLEEICGQFGLARTSAHEAGGRPRVSWRPPAGNLATGTCLDYVLFPAAWRSACVAQCVLPIEDTHSGIDHEPVAVEFAVDMWRPPKAAVRLDRAAMLTTEGRFQLQRIYETVPQVAWGTGIDDHLACINQHLQQGLAAAFPAIGRPRKPAMSARTWQLIRERREQRRIQRRRAALSSKWLLNQCFQAWHGTRLSNGRKIRRASQRQAWEAARHMANMRDLGRRLREAHQADEAEFVRLTYSDCREQGPATLARKLRSILRSGRGGAQAGIPEILRNGSVEIQGHADILRAFGDHFA